MPKFELVDLESNAFKRPLTPKQDMFVREYLIDLNATQAAIRAGYSAKTAYSIGEENLKKPEIAKAIQLGMDKRAEKAIITADEVLANIKRLAGKAEEMDDTGNALRANELLGKHLKLFTDKIEQSGNINLTVSTGIERGQ
ncbi:XtmA Phage terminase, small subunit [uncultured Caudovirales phage]|uniref:XtmA Phage terminase, small subunit n=1 Tax=uncultured Caudovirales phage TaxID=2100421 RepID=A0A6J5LBQ7_9CAUD|nr:XtmA Phage terminase, small subunit [uncultured Caudovirales phage]